MEKYEKWRYQFLNADIKRRKMEMNRDGVKIGSKLNKVDDFEVRKGIYGSLQKIDFECMANRNYYEELTQRIKSIKI